MGRKIRYVYPGGGNSVIFTESKLLGAFLVTPQPLRDERGFFARCFCKEEYQQRGIEFE